MRAIDAISDKSRTQLKQPVEKKEVEPKKVEEDAARFTKSEVRVAPQAELKQTAKVAETKSREIEPSQDSDSAKSEADTLDRTV